MGVPSERTIDPETIHERLREAGVAGAGGAGFPSYVKWADLSGIHSLMVNHQESEPNYYADKWLGRERAEELSTLFDAFLGESDANPDGSFDRVVVGTKEPYRDEWMGPFEAATDATVFGPEELPVTVTDHTGTLFVYTPNVYTYSEESVLLMVAAGTPIGEDLPTDHGWIVHNTETLYNIYRALFEDAPVTRTYVHVDGNTPEHRCLEVPIGTPASDLLEAAGIDDLDALDGQVLADGGPGWCYATDLSPEEFGVRKRTNAVLVLDEELATENTQEDGQIDVLTAAEWGPSDDRPHETEPTPLSPDVVRIPLITNAAYEGFVQPSVPVVEPGDTVSEGDVVAEPSSEGISIAQHASIDGTVEDVTDTHVIVRR